MMATENFGEACPLAIYMASGAKRSPGFVARRRLERTGTKCGASLLQAIKNQFADCFERGENAEPF